MPTVRVASYVNVEIVLKLGIFLKKKKKKKGFFKKKKKKKKTKQIKKKKQIFSQKFII